MKTETYTLPSHLSCSLFYGDESGMSKKQSLELDSWISKHLENYDMFCCVSISENPFFAFSNDFNKRAGECLEFTFQVSK